MERKLIKRYCQTEMCRNFCAYNLLVKILRHYAKSAWHWKHRIPRWLSGEKSACQCKGAGDIRFDPVGQEDLLEEEMATHSGKILWRRKKKPTPVFSASLVAQMVKSLPAVRETRVRSLGWKIPLEKEMATHSSILAWKIPWMEKPGGLQSMGSPRVGHSRVTSLSLSSILTWRIPWREEPGGLQSMGSQT